MKLVLCPTCDRHISAAEVTCPFCAREAEAETDGAMRGRARGLAAVLGASLLGVACTGAPVSPGAAGAATIPSPTPVVVPVPAYGMPPPPPPTPTLTSTPTPTPSSVPDAGAPSPVPDAGARARPRPKERPAVPAYGMPPRSSPLDSLE